MAGKASRLIPGLAATVLAIAAGLSFYWFTFHEQPASVAGRVSAKESSTGLEAPAWDPQTPVSLPGEAEELFRKAMEAYSRQDYAIASNWLYRAATLAPESPDVHFYLGISYVKTRDSVAGIRELKTVAGLGNNLYANKARLHLGQALIERGDGAGAREFLAPVAAAGGEQGAQARALIQSSYPKVGGS